MISERCRLWIHTGAAIVALAACDEHKKAGEDAGGPTDDSSSPTLEDGGCCASGQACSQSDQAKCGDCDAGDVADGSTCTAVPPCAGLPCELTHRTCVAAGEHGDEHCGVCLAGYMENSQRDCSPVSSMCTGSACESQCQSGQIWDWTLLKCRPVRICTDVKCAAPRECLEGDSSHDASCGCPSGQGWDVVGQKCLACDPKPASCNRIGESGNLMIGATASNACVCETVDGYFLASAGNAPDTCDADGDGWVNEGARPALGSTDPLVRATARCALRRVAAVLLVNEAGHEHPIDLTADFPTGLPLYESARNDGSTTSTTISPYQLGGLGRAPAPRELNSLTKACVGPREDYNDNGLSDVNEWEDADLAGGFTRGDALLQYYMRYTKLGYFLELHNGWYEAGASAERPGTYRIVEKPRQAGAAAPVPVRYPDGSPSYSQVCRRHTDALYTQKTPNTIGGDFSRYGDAAGMAHESQYKCVQILDQAAYGDQAREQTSPQQVYIHGNKLARLASSTSTPEERLYEWTVNDCYVEGSSENPPSGKDGRNPGFAPVHCSPATPVANSVRWATVGYTTYATKNNYQRGCINECVELGVQACPGYDPSTPPGSERYTCDHASTAVFGKLECGCGRNYGGGANCSVGCPSDGVMTGPKFSIETRADYWMCGGFSASSNPVLTGGGYKLRGEISTTAVDGTVLSGGGYTLRAR